MPTAKFLTPVLSKSRRLFWRWSFLITAAIYFLTVIGLFWYSAQATQQVVQSITVDEIAHQADIIAKFRTFYSNEIVSRASDHGMRISHDYKDTPHTLPLPATLMIDLGHYLGQFETNTRLHLYSSQPFPWRVQERQLDQFQKDALTHFTNGETEPFIREEIRNGQSVLRYAQADILSGSCVACHNSHPMSPKTDWKAGDVRGVLELSAPLTQLNITVEGLIRNIFILMFATSAIGLVLVWLAFRRLSRLAQTSRDQARLLTEKNHQLEDEMQSRSMIEQELRSSQVALVNAKDKAESANRLKDQFLANMSHEIRTPMNGIMGMTELVLQTPLTPEQTSHLRLAHNSAEHLVSIINDVLDFSKIDTGYLALQPVRMNPIEVVEHTIQNLSPQLQNKPVTLAVRSAPDVPTHIMADPVRFRQIMTNLIGNAIKFTHKGSISVYCDWLSRDMLRIAVTDTGIGFDSNQAETLFKPFVQADGSITRSYGGTGLGLAITRSLATLMGGKVWATGELGKGATFTFTIHAQTAEDEAASATALNEASNALAPAHNAINVSLSVLVAEDHPINQKILTLLLQKMGHRVVVVSDGTEALAALKTQTFDLVLMDVMMPGVDGLSALGQWRTHEQTKKQGHTPIVMVTAMAMAGDQERFLAAGADGYIAKPISAKTLIAEMERIFTLYPPHAT